MREELHKNANSKYGNRLLYSEIYKEAMGCYIERLGRNVDACRCEIVLEAPGKSELRVDDQEQDCG